MKAVKKPCPDCPFSKNVKPGALGGTPAASYIGQVFGPFVLPCHKQCDFDDPNWKSKVGEVGQCAGAAIFRGHVQVKLPDAIPVLPASPDVFEGPAEFMAHHTETNPGVWRLHFQNPSVIPALVSIQIHKAKLGQKP